MKDIKPGTPKKKKGLQDFTWLRERPCDIEKEMLRDAKRERDAAAPQALKGAK